MRTLPLPRNFENNYEFLEAYWAFRKQGSGSLTLKSWATELGYSNSGYICNLLKRQRRIQKGFIDRFIERQPLPEPDIRILYLRLAQETNQSAVENKILKDKISEISHVAHEMQNEEFEFISNWYHIVILELTELKGFRWDHAWISRCLGGKISEFEAEMAIKRLIKMKLLKVVAGKLLKTNTAISFSSATRNLAIQKIHMQSIETAKNALLTSPFESRDFNSATIAIHHSQVEAIKNAAQEFVHKLWKISSDSEALGCDSVYRINVQSFLMAEDPDNEQNTDICEDF